MDFLWNYLFISLPEFYILHLWGAVLFGYRFPEVKYRILLMAVISALASDLMWHFNLVADFRVIVTNALAIIFYRYVLPSTWRNALLMVIVTFGSLLICEVLVALLFLNFIDYEVIMGSLWLKFMITLAYISPLLSATVFIHKKHLSFQTWRQQKWQDKKITILWVSIFGLVVLQLYLIVFLNYFFYLDNYAIYHKMVMKIYGLPMISLGLVLINILLIAVIIKIKNRYTETELSRTENDYNEHLEKLISKLKMERHDFINELQTIHGFVQTGMYDHLKDYMNTLVQHVRAVNRSIKITNPPVSALLHTKMEQIERNGIKFETLVNTEDSFPYFKGTDLVKIVSNILDNAIRAVTDNKDQREPWIEIYWGKEDSTAVIQISNNGPKIDSYLIDLMFQKGYTTKQEKENSGYGLAIVQSIVHKYKGSIQVESTDDKTSFIVRLPIAS